jgi:dihydroorotate dehydrogenase electron transfer subunit
VFLLSSRITGKRAVAQGMWVISMDAPEIAATVRAGQFVNLGWAPGPLLRRPFSVYRVAGDDIEVVLKEVGTGTAQLLGMRLGDGISCLGPLGKGFEIAAGPVNIALVSGGLGVAPMPLAAKEARALGMTVTWVHGARNEDELCTEADGDDVIWATDDGSRGFAGTSVSAAPDADLVLACGPNRMLAAVAARWSDARVAVETYMGCGTGVCLGCAVPLKGGGYDRACKEGPVYRASDVDWPSLPSHLSYSLSPAGERSASPNLHAPGAQG